MTSSTCRQSSLEKFKAVNIILNFFVSKFVELRHLLTNLVADRKFAVISYDFVVLLSFKLFAAEWIITRNLTTDRLMFFNFSQVYYDGTERAFNLERIDDFLDDSGCASDLDVFVAHGAITIQQ